MDHSQISVLMDSEFQSVPSGNDIDALLRQLPQNADAAQTWWLFHLQGDVLRTGEASFSNEARFSQRFSKALSQEAIHFLSAHAQAQSSALTRRAAAWRRLALPAGISAAALLFVAVVVQQTHLYPTPAPVFAQVPEPYLMAHQQFSPVNPLQSAGEFQTVSVEKAAIAQ